MPSGYNFKIWDCQRSRTVQMAMINSFRRRFLVLYPKLSVGEREKLIFKFAARPLKHITRLDTHRNGGAVDLTVVDRKGNELYMGTDHDDVTSRAAMAHFERKKRLTMSEREAKKNRRLLRRAMMKAGFENYAPEWWHWSFNVPSA
ncbi:MAG: hypothetical protein IH870_06780 [Chloroflexi bacterium]|nr:hypothetical protein [Chloroflexota bacterium]